MRRTGMPWRLPEHYFRDFLSLFITTPTPGNLYDRALQIADQFNLGAVYDAHYLALAQLLGCDLWTADQRLINTVSGKLPFVRWIGDY